MLRSFYGQLLEHLVLPYCPALLFTVIVVAVTYSGQINGDDDDDEEKEGREEKRKWKGRNKRHERQDTQFCLLTKSWTEYATVCRGVYLFATNAPRTILGGGDLLKV